MAITLYAGSTFSIASAYGAAKTMSAISNTNPAVATLEASHGVIAGDILHFSSGWEFLDDVVLEVLSVDVNDVTIKGLDTTSTVKYPAGTGGGSVREVMAWTEITQIRRDISSTGGEQVYADTSTLKNRQDKKVPVSRTAVDMTLPIYDDPSLAWVAVIEAADAIPTAGRADYPGGSKMLYSAYHTLGDVATFEDSTMRNSIAIAFAAKSKRYAS